MNFYDAWIFLNEHSMFKHLFEQGLYTCVVKVNPETNEIDDDYAKNTKVQVWLEHGPWESQPDGLPQHTHDWDLDCGGDTFEDAIIELAMLVKKYYTDDGKKISMSEKEKLLEYISNPKVIDVRNRMGCSENWYDPYFAIKETFNIGEIQSMSDKEIENLVRLATEIGMALY